MSNINDFIIALGVMIDESSLAKAKKKLAKEQLKINADISFEDFSKSKIDLEKQILQLSRYIENTLGNAVASKVDAAMNDLSRVSNAATDELQHSLRRSTETAMAYAAAISSAVKATSRITGDRQGTAEDPSLKAPEANLESMKTKTQQIASVFQQLSQTILNSDFLKTLVDSGANYITTFLIDIVKVQSALRRFNQEVATGSSRVDAYRNNLGGLTQAQRRMAASALQSTSRMNVLGNAFTAANIKAKVAAIGMKVLGAALNSLIGLGIGFAITGLFGVVSNLINRQQILIDKAEEARQSYENLKEEVASINEELKTTQSRIAELQAKPSLTFAEQEDLNNLIAANTELERELAVKEKLARIEKSNVNQAAEEAIASNPTIFTHTEASMKHASQTRGLIENKEQELFLETDLKKVENLQKQLSKLEEKERSINKTIQTNISLLNEQAQGLDGSTGRSEKYISEIDRLNSLFLSDGTDKSAALDSIFNASDEYRQIYGALEEQARDSFVTASDVAQYKNFADTISAAGISVQSLASHLNASTAAQAGSLDSIKDYIRNYANGLAEVQELEQKMASGTSLSYLEKEAVLSKFSSIYPELINHIYRTAEGWSIEKSAIDQLMNSLGLNVTEQIRQQINLTEIALEQAKKRALIYLSESKAISPRQMILLGNEIVLLEAQRQSQQSAYDELNKMSAGSILGGSPSKLNTSTNTQDAHLEAFRAKYATIKHLYSMDIINQKEYLADLNALNKDYFEGNEKYLDQSRQYQEEVYKGGEELYNTYLKESTDSINDRNLYEDWAPDESESKAWREIADQTRTEFYEKGIISHERYAEQTKELNRKIYEAEKREIEDAQNKKKELLEQQKEDINSIIDLTVDLIKHETDAMIDALEEEKVQRKNILDLQKESLRTTEAQKKYESEVADKNAELSQLQARANLLELDDSREAQLQLAQLKEEIFQKQKDLNQFMHDDAVEKKEEALDKEYEGFEKEKDTEIEKLKEYLNSSGKLIQAAMTRIDLEGDILYQKLIKWNADYGTGVENDITSAWSSALAALEGYKSTLEAVNNITNELSSMDQSDSGSGNNPSANHRTKEQIVAEMKSNAAKWRATNDSQEKTDLAKANQLLGYGELKRFYPDIYYDSVSGKWYKNKDKKEPVFHSGLEAGFVGDNYTLKQKEIYAKLTKDELVLNKDDQYRLGNMISTGQFYAKSLLHIADFNSVFHSVGSNSSPVNIKVDAPVTIHGTDRDTAKKLGAFGVSLSATIYDQFAKNGYKSNIAMKSTKL